MQKQQDDALLAAFHLMDADERQFHLDSFMATVQGRPIKPKLKLVGGTGDLDTTRPFERRLG